VSSMGFGLREGGCAEEVGANQKMVSPAGGFLRSLLSPDCVFVEFYDERR